MHKFLIKILNLILPPRCINCGKILMDDIGLCPECFNEINFISQPYCKKCGLPFENAPNSKSLLCGHCMKKGKSIFRLGRSAIKYDDASKNLVLSFKFMDKTDNAKVFAQWLKIAGKDIFSDGVDVIVPIPLHFTRLVKRRYNQSALLARELSKLTGIRTDYNSVIRHRKTKPQVQFSGHARVKNVKDAFSVKYIDRIKGQRVLLIDDVLTTGSTLKECALALKKAGAKSVDSLTVARVCK